MRLPIQVRTFVSGDGRPLRPGRAAGQLALRRQTESVDCSQFASS